MIHRFNIGQRVRLSGSYLHRNAADGFYEVIRQLPFGEGDYQYRIKSAREQHERVVKECELEADGQSSVTQSARASSSDVANRLFQAQKE